MRYIDRQFERETVELDGNQFDNCRFVDCKLVFSGYNPVSLHRCVFNDCEWAFEGPAGNTLDFLSVLYQGLGTSGQELVEVIIKGIREGTFPTGRPIPALAR